MISTIYERHNYLNPYVELLINERIYEYDIQSAGFNLLKYYHLIDDKTFKMLSRLDKKHRQIQIGLMCRKDSQLNKDLNDAFVNVRKEFFVANQIQDDEILSIKKDAIFIMRPCDNVQFDNIFFVLKNLYTSFLLIDRKQLYYNKDILDVKGIDNTLLEQHKDYMCDFISTYLNYLEFDNIKSLRKFLVEFSELYKERELPIEYYREFNTTSCYRYIKDRGVLFDSLGDIDMVDIRYNYLNIIIPMVNLII